MGVLAALVVKVGEEILLTYGMGRPLYRCPDSIHNFHCSVFDWVTNVGDLVVVVVPTFLVVTVLASLFVHSK